MKKQLLLIIIIITVLSNCILSSEITGIILDENAQAINGVNVILSGTILGAASNDSGFFRIERVPPGSYSIICRSVGYKHREIAIDVQKNKSLNVGEIILVQDLLESVPVVVTAGKFEQKSRDVPLSVNIITSRHIENHNSVTIDQVLQYVSGVSLNQDQVNIRGSSGYSRGVGSRVMMLVDGMPFITGDTQGIKFDAIAVNNIDRIEVVKGAGSSLYGSSALGGVINVITKPVSDLPKTKIAAFAGIYDDPHWKQWQWTDEHRFLNGLQIEHSRKIKGVGLRIAAARDQDDSYRKNDWNRRYNFSGKLEFNFSPFDKITINGNITDKHNASFLYWKDLQNAFIPPDGQIGNKNHSNRWYSSAAYQKILSKNAYIKLNTLWYHNYFKDNIDDGNHSKSDLKYAELQTNVNFKNHIVTAGGTVSFNTVDSDMFGDRYAIGGALYLQDQYKLNDTWVLNGGMRLDYFELDKIETYYSLNPRLGLVYKAGKHTTMRLSGGTGFRAPSLGEAFTSTYAEGFLVVPNLNLKPENGISVEAGLNQILSPVTVADVAVFYNRYFDLIEGGFTPENNIQFDNITNALIRGIETTFDWWVIPQKLYFNTGYTFIDPYNITEDDYLNYRPRHTLYSGIQWFYKKFETGIDYRFTSRYDRIDKKFILFIQDAEERVATNVVDLKLSYHTRLSSRSLLLTFYLKNVFQYHYTDLIGSVAPGRTAILRFDLDI